MEINLGKLAFDLDFHPSEQLVTTGLIDGDLHLYRYSSGSVPERVLEVHAHSESCRAARFVNGGSAILTGSPDHTILATDVETGSAIARLENAHEDAINRLINLTASTIASGDDGGCIKVWDTRQRSCCNSFQAHEDYISDMTFSADYMKLLGTSGDGTLSVCNLRRNKVQDKSEFSEDELLSVVIMKNGQKVICSSQTGNILLYSWGCFKDCSDRFIDLSPNSVDALLKLDEDRLIAGSETGLISLVGILPNRIIQPIAEHSEYPVERLAFSHDKKFLGSIAHDQMLKEVSSSFMHSLLITVSCSCGIWMIYCKALEILHGLKQLWWTVIVMRWIQILILQSLEKEQREKMQAKIMLWVHTTFLPIYRWMVDYKFSLTLTDNVAEEHKLPLSITYC